ncbi:transglycosylase domain-containing protein, partial [Burkholderia cepacia]
MNRFVPLLRDAWLRCRARVAPLAAASRARIRALCAGAWHRLRHPTRRGVALTLAAIPLVGLLVLLAFVPFTPSIGDIRKARIDRPARVLSADGQVIAEFRPVNREWVPLKQISPHMVNALIATEDHRFYAHHGIDWRRTLAAGLHTFSGSRQGGSTI